MDDGKFEHWLAGNVPESFFVMHATAAGSALSDCEYSFFLLATSQIDRLANLVFVCIRAPETR